MLDSSCIVRQFVSTDDSNYTVLREVNLSHISAFKEKVKSLKELEWSHVVMSSRCITLPDYSTYSLESDLNVFYDA